MGGRIDVEDCQVHAFGEPALTPPARPRSLEAAAKYTAQLPSGPGERKSIPLCRGVLDYFPAALVEVAKCSKAGNDQHNPGQEMHHARQKSSDHADCILRHLVDRGTRDTDGIRHSVKVAWRALALLQEELEREEGAPLPRGAKVTP